MSLTPAEVIRWQFRRALWGYSVREVKAFLVQVSEALGQLLEENRLLKEERERLLERLQTYQAIEQQLQNALVSAQKMSDEIKQQAHREAELILAQAQQEADRWKMDAHRQVEKALEEVERLRQVKMRLLAELRCLLTTYLELLDQAEEKAPFAQDLKEPKEQVG